MNNGWIKLHRKFLENPISNKPQYLSIWITILLLANHKENKIMWNGDILIIKEGQFLTGRKELSKQTGVPETTIERALDLLEKLGQIGQQKTTKFRLITVLNWKEYQNVDNKRTTNGQQTDTNKNDKNEKNDKKQVCELFETFWNLYDKKVGREKSIKKWNKLSLIEKKKILNYIPQYKIAQPIKRYRKNPETFLNNKSWNDELVSCDEKEPMQEVGQYKFYSKEEILEAEKQGKIKWDNKWVINN